MCVISLEYVPVLPGIEKWLYHLPQSQNNWIQKPILIKNLVTCSEVQLGGVKPGRTTECIVLTVHILPAPLMVDLSDMHGELSAEC
jgi:hypothetical protein